MNYEYKVTLLVPIEVTVISPEPLTLPNVQYQADRQARQSVRFPASLTQGPIVFQAMSEKVTK